MAEKKIKLPVRSALVPNFYKSFHCLMGDCQDNCCDDGWNIEFSKKDYLCVKRAAEHDPELRELVSQGMRRLRERAYGDSMYAEFRVTDEGRCAFHTKEGLCKLQLVCGEDTLPNVCRTYPRKSGYTPAAKEYCLSPSCEGVLQQLWALPDGIEFVEDALPKQEWRDITFTAGEKLYGSFAPIRALCVDILQNRAITLTQRLLCLGLVLQRLQRDEWRTFDADSWAEQMAALAGTEEFAALARKIEGNQTLYIAQNMKVLNVISANTKGWPHELLQSLEGGSAISLKQTETGLQADKLTLEYAPKAYKAALAQFQAAFSDREYFFENLMVAVVLYLDFPHLTSKEALWKSYVSLCSLYSFYRFVSVLGCKDEQTKERLFHYIVMASRATLHNQSRLNSFQDELFHNDSSTLAHMAILLHWD